VKHDELVESILVLLSCCKYHTDDEGRVYEREWADVPELEALDFFQRSRNVSLSPQPPFG
jgi:hypothetical protein